MKNFSFVVSLVLFTFLICIILPACSEKKNDNIQTSDIKDSATHNKSVNSISNIDDVKIPDDIVKVNNGKPVDPAKLNKILPRELPGFDKSPSSEGSVEGINGWSKVTASYSHKLQGSFILSIKDYSSLITRENKELYFNPKGFQGITLKSIKGDNISGYSFWDPKIRKGSLSVLVFGRFGVNIESDYLPETINSIEEIFKLIKIADFKNL